MALLAAAGLWFAPSAAHAQEITRGGGEGGFGAGNGGGGGGGGSGLGGSFDGADGDIGNGGVGGNGAGSAGAGTGGSLGGTTTAPAIGLGYSGGAGVSGVGTDGGGGGGTGLLFNVFDGRNLDTGGQGISGGDGGDMASGGGGGGGTGLYSFIGSVTVSSSSIVGGYGGNASAGSGGDGGAGVFLRGGGALDLVAGAIHGGKGGGSSGVLSSISSGGNGGVGVAGNFATIVNRGGIMAGGFGGYGLAGNTSFAGHGGIGVSAYRSAVSNMAGASMEGGRGGDAQGTAGRGGIGVALAAGGGSSLINAGAITGGHGGDGTGFGAGGGGGTGVVLNENRVTNTSGGTITGGAGGTAGFANGGVGGSGVNSSSGTVINEAGARITGGAGGSTVFGGAAGGDAVIISATGNLINAGDITGGAAAFIPASSAIGGGVGVMVSGTGGTRVVNSGHVSGGQHHNGTRANAVELTGNGNVLELWQGYSFTGNVVASGTNNMLVLGGANSATFDVSQLGALASTAQYQGFAGFQKTGTSIWTLTGTSTDTAPWTVSAGTLSVNGSIAPSSLVTVNAGGTLGGTGTVGTTVVNAGGVVAPGNSIGTLTVAGNVAFAAGSTYQVEINATGQSDRIVTSGAATLNGGRVEVLAENGNYAASTTYTILTAAGGVTGRFADATSNLVFLEPSLVYDSNNVVLTMTRNATSFGPEGGAAGDSVAATRNQGFIANAAERLGAGNPVYDTLLSGTAAEARAGFDLLSGEAHAQAVSVMIDESRLVRETILNRLRGPLLTAPAGQVAASFSADLPGRKGAVLMNAPQPRYALWGEAFGGAGNSDADGNAASQSRRTGGALLGADLMLYDAPGSSLKVGVAGGYSQSRFDLDARRSSGKLESGHAALYAGARFGALRLDAGLAYSWSESDIRRQVQIRGFGDSLRLQRPGAVAQGFAELGYGFAFQGFALEPFAQLALIRVSTDAGTEQGGAAALRVLSSEQALGFSTLGLRAEAQIGAMPLFARAMLGWRHGFGELTPQARTAFALGTTPARVFAAPIDRDALTAEAGLDWRISSATALGLTYSAAIGERSRDHALKGRVEMRF
ncbi:autotransporter domain-containing protein [Bosea vestrisii]|uniref:autotransporter outer membrane beta-barrel domain-containing protein n=1 Tax=Bosea vestrisii TaxID=151416 RepID=UPI0024DF5B55|nr:autotransporter domain-containing protein [Bosea vestrisii]WID95806.1 autotransporter domain-containing protein [Bosea vestrisii]